MDLLQTSLIGYAESIERSAYYVHPAPGYLRLSGADRRAYLQRQTTNDINTLAPGKVQQTVLTSPAARILDVLNLFDEAGDYIGILTLPGQGQETFRYFRSRIFFNDKVALEDASPGFALIDLLGPGTAPCLNDLGVDQIPSGDVWQVLDRDGLQLRIWAIQEFDFRPTLHSGFHLLLSIHQLDELKLILQNFKLVELSLAAYDVLRVEAGQPASGHELTESYTPLEVGLGQAISHTKGCYTGQEVIARQITYDKVTRQMVGLKLQAAVNVGDNIQLPDQDQNIGKVTSAAFSPRFGPIALGVVRKPYDQPGTRLLVGDSSRSHPGVVTALPF
jgi:tRNA-modifying protein YgfZ